MAALDIYYGGFEVTDFDDGIDIKYTDSEGFEYHKVCTSIEGAVSYIDEVADDANIAEEVIHRLYETCYEEEQS